MAEKCKDNSNSNVLRGKYDLGRLLGHGTFAKVYLARNLQTGKSVAMKVVGKEKVIRVGMMDQVKREISVMKMVKHPNIVELHEVLASKSKIYFAMDLVRGGELFSKVSKGRLREDVARSYFQQLMSAVDFCHSRGVYHRDLKPENLLLDEELLSLSNAMAAVAVVAGAQFSSLCFSSSNQSSPLPSSSQHPNHHLTTKPKTLLQALPLSTSEQTKLSLQFKEKILCLEIMGVDSGRALSLNPDLHTATLNSIHSIISFLESKGIHQKDMGRIFGMCPKILTSSIKNDLNPVFQFLSRDLDVPVQNFRRAINKCPRLLVSSVGDQLKPALIYLQRLGFRDLEALAYQDSILLVSSVEKTIIPKLEYLMSCGFSREDAVGMVLRCPGLFTFSIENNFKPKFGYFVGELGGSLEDLKEFPQYFSFSLEKRIKPRHKEIMENGVKIPLPVMLKGTDEEFIELLKQGDG